MKKMKKKILCIGLASALLVGSLEPLSGIFSPRMIHAATTSSGDLVPGATLDDSASHIMNATDFTNQSNWTLKGSASWNSGNNGTATLINNTKDSVGYGIFNYALDMSQPVSFQVAINTNTGYNDSGNGGTLPDHSGDALGIVLTPVPASQFTTGRPGGGLGVAGLSNSIFVGRDLYCNTNTKDGNYTYTDSTVGQPTTLGISTSSNASDQFAIRTTNDSGVLAGSYPCGAVGRQRAGLGDILSFSWGGITDNGDGTVTGTLTATLTGLAHTYNTLVDKSTRNVPGVATLSQTITVSKSMTLGTTAASGSYTSVLTTSISGDTLDSSTFNVTRGTAPVKVNYLNAKTGEVIADPTTIIANVGETYGAVKDTNSFVGSDTYDYMIPSLPGYSYYGMSTGVSGTAPAAPNNSASVLVANHDDADNEINVYYNQLSSTSFSFSYASGGVNYPPLPTPLTFQGEAGETIPDIEAALRSKIPAGYIATCFTDLIQGGFLQESEDKDLISDVGVNTTPSPYVFGNGDSKYEFTLSPMRVLQNIRYAWDDSVPDGLKTTLPNDISCEGAVDSPLNSPATGLKIEAIPAGFYAKVLTQSGTYYGDETTTPEEALNLAIQSVHGPSGIAGTFAAPTTIAEGPSFSSNTFTIVLFSNGTIDFTAPDTIDFGSHQVSPKTETYEGQLDKNVDVKDARLASKMTSWSIQLNEDPTWGTDRHGIQEARFDGTSWIPTGGVSFEGYLKYKDVVLSDTPQTVYNSPDSGYAGGVTTVVDQSKPSPFTLEVPAGLQRTNTKFIGKVQWTLSVTP